MDQPKGNPEVADVSQDDVNDAIFGSNNDEFFSDLDQEVNGVVLDDQPQDKVVETQTSPKGDNSAPSDNNVDYEKRYKDSSREAQKLKSKLDHFEPFMPILDRLSEDDGLVNVVKEYLVKGDQPEKIEMPEDFEFDIQDALSNPKSDSATYFNKLMDNAVSSKVNNVLGEERKRTETQKAQANMETQAQEFKQKTGMTDSDFEDLLNWSNKHKMTYDDLYALKNKTQVNQNVSNATKQDMLNQMKAVRDIPTSVANVNSQQVNEDPNKQVLEALKGLDSGVDNLFG